MGEVPDRIPEQVAPQLAGAFGHTFGVVLALTAVLIVPALPLPRHGARRDEAADAPPMG